MPKKQNKNNISNLEIYNKLESLEKKIENEKSKRKSNFIVTFLTSIGLALFIVGLMFFIQLLDDLGGSLWVTSIGYMVFGVSLLIIGIIKNSQDNSSSDKKDKK